MSNQAGITNYLDWADQGCPAWWRYVLTIVLTCLLWIFLPVLMVIPLGPFLQGPQMSVLLVPYSFLPGFLVTPLLAALILRRPGWTIALPQWPPRIVDYVAGAAIGILVGLLFAILCYPFLPFEYRGLAPLAALGLPTIGALLLGLVAQTGFEELLFRGLLGQFVYRLSHSPIFAIGVPALLFGALHVGNVKAWHGDLITATPYVFAGLVFGWAAWRSGSLMLAAGLHFANNSFNTLVISTKGDILPPLGPLVTDMPTIQQGVMLSGIQAVLTVLFVEIYLRNRSKDRAALS